MQCRVTPDSGYTATPSRFIGAVKGTTFGSSCHAKGRRRARLPLGHGARCIALTKQRCPPKYAARQAGRPAGRPA